MLYVVYSICVEARTAMWCLNILERCFHRFHIVIDVNTIEPCNNAHLGNPEIDRLHGFFRYFASHFIVKLKVGDLKNVRVFRFFA